MIGIQDIKRTTSDKQLPAADGPSTELWKPSRELVDGPISDIFPMLDNAALPQSMMGIDPMHMNLGMLGAPVLCGIGEHRTAPLMNPFSSTLEPTSISSHEQQYQPDAMARQPMGTFDGGYLYNINI